MRGARHGGPHAPATGYRYDGLYRVADYWPQSRRDGPLVWRFRLERIAPEVVARRVGEAPELFDDAGDAAPGATSLSSRA